MAHRPLTGALLVGGRSRRFGSPKALAELGGHTLLERGVATLRAACDEVVVVGKGDIAAEPGVVLVDDGAVDHAPVHGVIAALETAQHDACVIVPVDCVRITPAAVRRLGDDLAVSRTGPLPGAYGPQHLELLRGRVAGGALTLRDVNLRRSAVPDALLADVDTPSELAVHEAPCHAVVVGFSRLRDGIEAALVGAGHRVTYLPDEPSGDDELFAVTAAHGPFDVVVCATWASAALVALHATPFAHVLVLEGSSPAPVASHVSIDVLDAAAPLERIVAALRR